LKWVSGVWCKLTSSWWKTLKMYDVFCALYFYVISEEKLGSSGSKLFWYLYLDWVLTIVLWVHLFHLYLQSYQISWELPCQHGRTKQTSFRKKIYKRTYFQKWRKQSQNLLCPDQMETRKDKIFKTKNCGKNLAIIHEKKFQL